MKLAALVVSAIQDLRETKGSTSKQIAGYISYASSLSEQRVKRQVRLWIYIFNQIFVTNLCILYVIIDFRARHDKFNRV